jgi:hypothetical protein
MLSISLEFPPGVAPPTIKGVLRGAADDLRIEIRLADFVEAIKEAQGLGATVAMVPRVAEHTPAPAPPAVAKKAAPVKRVAVAPALKPQDKPEAAAPAAKPAPNQDAVLKHLEGGACTTSELRAELSKRLNTSPDCITQALYACSQKGLVEKFEDAQNGGLAKWRLKK